MATIIEQAQTRISQLRGQIKGRTGNLLGGSLGGSGNPENNLAGGIVQKLRGRVSEIQTRIQGIRPGMIARGPMARPAAPLARPATVARPVPASTGANIALEKPLRAKKPSFPPEEVKIF